MHIASSILFIQYVTVCYCLFFFLMLTNLVFHQYKTRLAGFWFLLKWLHCTECQQNPVRSPVSFLCEFLHLRRTLNKHSFKKTVKGTIMTGALVGMGWKPEGGSWLGFHLSHHCRVRPQKQKLGDPMLKIFILNQAFLSNILPS